MFDAKATRFLRVSIDLEPKHAVKTDELLAQGTFSTRRSVFEAAIDVLHACYRLKKKGYRLRGVDPLNGETVEIDPVDLPRIELQAEGRRVGIRSAEKPVRKLLEIAKGLRDPELLRITTTISSEVWNPANKSPAVETETIAYLIYICRTLNDPELLAATRDLLTTSCTSFNSFEHMLAQTLHGYRPAFNTRFIEEGFLEHEFTRELMKTRPHEFSSLRAKGQI